MVFQHMSLVASSPGSTQLFNVAREISACNIEKLGVAWVRGYEPGVRSLKCTHTWHVWMLSYCLRVWSLTEMFTDPEGMKRFYLMLVLSLSLLTFTKQHPSPVLSWTSIIKLSQGSCCSSSTSLSLLPTLTHWASNTPLTIFGTSSLMDRRSG